MPKRKRKSKDAAAPAAEDKEYEVEKILNKRVKKGKIEYYIKWKNFNE